MPDSDTPKVDKGGRPKGVVTFAGLDAKKKRIFARFLNRHVFKTLADLDSRLAEQNLQTLEALALRTLLRAAATGDARSSDLILNTAPKSGADKPAGEKLPEQELPTFVDDELPA